MTKTLFSLKPYFRIICVVNTFTVSKKKLFITVKKLYGYDLDGITFIAIPKRKLQGLRFHLTLKQLLDLSKGEDTCFYTRSYSLAKRLVRSRFWHHKKVILETHKKDGYYKEELVPDSPYRAQRRAIETNNQSRKFLQKLYKKADGLIFISRSSEQIVQCDLGIHHSSHIWYPLDKKYTDVPSLRPGNFVYCGSLGQGKLMDLLLDALTFTPAHIVIDVYGGKENERRALQQTAKQKNISSKLLFKGTIPYQQLSTVLQGYRFGIATMEGIKVVDYLENGLVPIIPRLGTYLGIFRDDQVIYFVPDSPSSLAKALITASQHAETRADVDNIGDSYSLKSFGKRLAADIWRFTHA